MADIKDIKNIPIVEYASTIGLTLVKKGKHYSSKEHDSLMIDPYKNTFVRYANGKSGSIIDFVMAFENKDLKTAIKDLGKLVDDTNYKPTPRPIDPSPKPVVPVGDIELPPANEHNKNVFAYLTSTRKIDKGIVQEMIKNKNLYQDTHNNCVFVSYDKNGKPIFANVRGTNTGKRFVGDIKGCDYTHCFFMNNNSPVLIVSESVIDSLSIMTQTKENGKKPKIFNYLSLSGASKITAVETHVKEHTNIKTVVIALDNDEAGRKNAEKIHTLLEPYNLKVIDKFPTQGKDWNEELILTIEEKHKTTEKKICEKEVNP